MKRMMLAAVLLFTGAAFSQARDDAAERAAVARFGADIAAAFNARDPRAMQSLIDVRALGTRAAKFLALKSTEQADFVRGFETNASSQLTGAFIRMLEASEGSAKFMRVTDTVPARALLRMDMGDNGFDYLEFVVDTHGKRPRTVDWFRLSSGELMSVTLGGIGQLYTTEDPGLLGRLFGVDRVEHSTVKKLRQAGDFHRQGKYAEVLAVLRELPEPVANSRIMLTSQATMAVLSKQESEYARILATLARKYSNEPSTAFMLIDHYFNEKDLPHMLESIDTVEKRVGMDGVTRLLRGSAYFVAEDFNQALKHIDEAIKLEPDRLAAFDSRATTLVRLGRFDDAVAQFRGMEQQFSLRFTRENFGTAEFAKFTASRQFEAWLPQ